MTKLQTLPFITITEYRSTRTISNPVRNIPSAETRIRKPKNRKKLTDHVKRTVPLVRVQTYQNGKKSFLTKTTHISLILNTI